MNLQESIRRILREETYSPAGEEYKPARVVIHASNPVFRDNIKLKGLQVSVGECYQVYVNRNETNPDKIKCKKAIFATDSLKKRDMFNSTYDDDIWLINTECANVKWYKDKHFDYPDSKHIVTFENISPECIKLIHKGTGKNEDYLQESIRRILREDNNESENRLTTWLSTQYDRFFDNLELDVTSDERFGETIYGKWYDKKNNQIFTRNDWGTFWIDDCESYKTLRLYSKLLSLSFEEFENNLIKYLNDRYGDKFFGKPIKSVGDENFCLENDEQEWINESDPKTGTGKKPEGSGRRLYTDENPNDTVSVKFRTKEDIMDTLNKDSFKSKPHKRQSQIINLIHQRVRAAYQNTKDPETKKRLRRAYDYIVSEKEKSKEKTIRLQKQEQNESELTEKCWAGYTQKGMKTMFGKRYPNCVKKTKK